MGVIWQKVWFDIWHNKVRTVLAVLSIAAGVFAVGAIFGMSDQMLSGMDRAHQAVQPSHISMFLTTPVDRDVLVGLNKVPGVEAVEPTKSVTVRFKAQPGDPWRDGVVVMRDDYPRQKYDIVQLREGPWPHGGKLGIERLSSQFYKMDIGDRVILEIDRQEKSFPIESKIRHPFVPPPQFGGQAFFFTDAEGMEAFHLQQGQFSDFLVRVTPYSADHAKEVASAIKERLAKQGITVAATLYQNPNKHWGRVFVEGMTAVLEILAVVTLLMSVILVLNTATALITQQTNQIGVIKALGGSTSTIVKVYLSGILVYGLLALCISLPAGMFLALGITSWFLNLFNIDYAGFHFSNLAVGMQVAAALVVPVLAALWPVLKGAAMTVRQAISTYGLGGDFSNSRLDRTVERVGQRLLAPAYAMALSNTFRRKGRLILSLLVLVTAGAMFLIVMSLSSSITATLDTEFARRTYNLDVRFESPQRIDRATDLAQSVDGVEKAVMWYSQPASILLKGQKLSEAGLGTTLIGLPVDDPMYKPLIVAGRWLQPGDGRVVVMGKESADDNHIVVGDTVTLDLGDQGKADWQVIGLYQVVFGGNFNVDSLYAPQDAAFAASKKHNEGARLLVRSQARDAAEAKALGDQLDSLYKSHGMRVAIIESIYATKAQASGQFGILISMLLMLAVIVAVVGGIGLMGALSISVLERTKEIGVLRAIGARSRTIRGMMMMEGTLQGLLSWLIAAPLAFFAGQAASKVLGRVLFSTDLDYSYNLTAVGIWLILVLVIAVLASILPARSATHISVRESLIYE